MSIALLVAALLIFNAGLVMGRCFAARYAYREGHSDGYDQAQRDMADDAAVVLDLEAQYGLPAREPR